MRGDHSKLWSSEGTKKTKQLLLKNIYIGIVNPLTAFAPDFEVSWSLAVLNPRFEIQIFQYE